VPVSASVADLEAIFNLNETGAAIWDKLDGTRALEKVIAEIRDEYEDEGRPIEEDVVAFVGELIDAGLAEA
jgi:hypothetical protein